MCAAKTLCFYYPTKIVMVDDNKAFLENLPENLSSVNKHQLFDSPKEALAFFEEIKEVFPTPNDFLGATNDLATGESLNVNIPKICALLQNKKRHEIPAVVIVDHDMPEMTGIEFCRKLKDYPVKKIMLTGTSDLNLAIQAFNDGIIDKFITKDHANVFQVIDHAIQELQQEYFAALSNHIVKNIITTTPSFLENSAFQDFFKKLLKENEITEFYLSAPLGSFLLMNNKGDISQLVVQSDQEIENYLLIAEDQDASAEIIEAIASKQKLLCLFSEQDFKQPVKNWERYLYPRQKIDNIETGYYTIVKT